MRRMERLVAVGAVIFFGSLLAAGYYSGRQFDPGILDLQSRDLNPRGYWIAAVGTAVAMLLLFPVAWQFYRRLRAAHTVWAPLGTGLFAAGLLAAFVLCLEPFAEICWPVSLHTFSRYVVFTLLLLFAWLTLTSAGLAVCLFLTARLARRLSGRLSMTLFVLSAVNAGLLGYLVYGFFAPDLPGSGEVLVWAIPLNLFVCTYAVAATFHRLEPG